VLRRSVGVSGLPLFRPNDDGYEGEGRVGIRRNGETSCRFGGGAPQLLGAAHVVGDACGDSEDKLTTRDGTKIGAGLRVPIRTVAVLASWSMSLPNVHVISLATLRGRLCGSEDDDVEYEFECEKFDTSAISLSAYSDP